MGRLLHAFVFRLRKDIAFKITLFIGLGIALFLTLIFFAIDRLIPEETGIKLLTGQNMLLSSLSPTQNFGIAVPINLIAYTVLEFNHGTIRNKIICGHSKAKIYSSLFINGLMYTFVLMGAYVLFCFALGSIFGGFDPHGAALSAQGLLGKGYLLEELLVAVIAYILIVSLTIFFSTLFRSIGPTISVVILVVILASVSVTIFSSVAYFLNPGSIWALRILNPFYALNVTEIYTSGGVNYAYLSNETLISSVISGLVYSIILFVAGIEIFIHRDIK